MLCRGSWIPDRRVGPLLWWLAVIVTQVHGTELSRVAMNPLRDQSDAEFPLWGSPFTSRGASSEVTQSICQTSAQLGAVGFSSAMAIGVPVRIVT